MDDNNKRLYDDVGGQVVKCSDCKNRNGITMTCKAFPKGIPFTEIIKKDGECNKGIHYEPNNAPNTTQS